MTASFFAYGSLIFPEIMYRVTGGQPKAKDAVLENYSRYLVENACYPGITKKAYGRVSGKLYLEVNQTTFKALDNFEGKLYERREVEIVTERKIVKAQTFIITSEYIDRLSSRPWNPDTFRRKYYDAFIKDIRSMSHQENMWGES